MPRPKSAPCAQKNRRAIEFELRGLVLQQNLY